MLDLKPIKAREAAATKGPWDDTDPRCIRHAEPNIYVGDEEIADVYGHNDSQFIAHARQDIPALIAEVERLRAALHKVAARTDSEMQFARTLHYDMRYWAQEALS